MSTRSLLFLVVLLPLFASAQTQVTPPFNQPTLTVLLANRPAHLEQQQWLAMMEKPVNRSLYPLRVTQTMLDTLDATQLDRRYQYVMVSERAGAAQGIPRTTAGPRE